MKTSCQIQQECEEILKLLKNCIEEKGWRARYLGSCSKLTLKYSDCQIKQFEQQRLEHNLAAKKKWEGLDKQ